MTALTSAPRSSRDLAIDVSDVTKVYTAGITRKRVDALRGISLRVDRGAVFGLLGPNGAGKSTLVKILLTVIRATHCKGTMLGKPVGDRSTLQRVGYLPEHHRFPDYLTASQVLDYFGAMGNVDRPTRRRRGAELLELVGLRDWADTRIKGFSKGMRQRLGIANALIGDPDLIVLDEPTDGVDPVGRRDIRAILLHLRDQGKTVFLNSHLLSELEMVCDQVAILVQGLVSSQGTIEQLTLDSRRYEIEVAPGDNGAAHKPIPAALGAVATFASNQGGGHVGTEPQASTSTTGILAGGTAFAIDHHTIRVESDDAGAIQPLIDALRASAFTIRAVRPIRSSLEDLFMQAVTDPLTGQVLAPGAKGGPAGDGRTVR